MRTTTASLCFSLGLCCCVAACGGSRPSDTGEHTQGAAQLGGEVVSTVDGVAIHVADVQQLVDATRLTPREALERLQSQALLSGEAQRRGFADDPEVLHVERQARVQSLLARDVESVRATDEEIAAEYEKQHARFHTPELRRASHVLARLPEHPTPAQDAAARALAQEACHVFADNDDVDAVMQQFRALSSVKQPVVAEVLPAVANGGDFVKPFLDALFGARGEGPLAQPVRTQFGWHAIVVTEIVPATSVSLASATPVLRKEIETAKHRVVADALVARLRAETKVVEDDKHKSALAGLVF